MGEWKKSQIGNLAYGIRGVSYKPYHLKLLVEDGDFVLLRSNNIRDNEINFEQIQIVPGNIVSDEQEARDKDIAVCMSNGSKTLVGKSGVYHSTGEKHTVGAFCSLFRPLQNADPAFVQYIFQGAVYKKAIERILSGSAINNLHNSIVEAIELDVPSDIKEQSCIAAVLTAADEAIAASRALVEKYTAVKQGLMQDLLSGRVRLSGFKGDWEPLKIGNLLEFKNGLNKGKEFFGEGIPIVNYMDVYSKPGIHAAELEGRVRLSKDEIKRFEVRKGDVFFTRTSETVNEVGYASVLLDDVKDGVFSGFVLRGRPKNDKLDILYCQYCFSTAEIRRAIIVGATYTTRALTSGTYLSTIPILLPKPDEQHAIAEAIMAADERLTAERDRLRKLEHIKRGLMDDLLTNRVSTDKLQGGV